MESGFPDEGSGRSASFGLLRLFVTLVSEVSGFSTEHAEVIVKAPFLLIGGELTILPQLGSEVRPRRTGHRFVGWLGGAGSAGGWGGIARLRFLLSRLG